MAMQNHVDTGQHLNQNRSESRAVFTMQTGYSVIMTLCRSRFLVTTLFSIC